MCIRDSLLFAPLLPFTGCKSAPGPEGGGDYAASIQQIVGSQSLAALRWPCLLYTSVSEGGSYVAYPLDWGVSYTLPTTTEKAVPDIAIRGVTGNRTEFVHLFSYLNGHYTATGCNALWDKNEMGDVVISACK